jgi:hypothetical protein
VLICSDENSLPPSSDRVLRGEQGRGPLARNIDGAGSALIKTRPDGGTANAAHCMLTNEASTSP